MEEKVFFTNKHGQKLCGILQKPKKYTEKCVILCHGFASDKDAHGVYIDLTNELVARDFAVFRFDFASRGESEGEELETSLFSQVQDLSAAVAFVSLEYTKIGVVASSFAGGVVLEYGGQYPSRFAAVVLWNPLIDYNWDDVTMIWNKTQWGNNAIQKIEKDGFTMIGKGSKKVGREFIEQLQRENPWQQIDHMSAPILFIHGTGDAVVSYAQSVYYTKMFELPLVTIDEGEHGFTTNYKHEEQANRATVEFFLKNMMSEDK